MKNKILKGILLVTIISSVILMACSKEKDCKVCSTPSENKEVYIGKNLVTGQSFRNSSGTGLEVTYLRNNVKSYFKSVMDKGTININSENVIGLGLFYTSNISNYSDLMNYTPTSILVYTKMDNKIITHCYFSNGSANYTADESLTAITSVISATDLFNINKGANLNSKELVFLMDSKEIPKVSYNSDFQNKTLQFAARPTPGDGPDKPLCNIMPECKNWAVKGSCIITEQESGPEQSYCIVWSDCGARVSMNALIANGYNLRPLIIENLHSLRDNFLGKSIKGSTYIDNFYYASKFFDITNLNPNFLTSTFNFYNSNIVHKLGSINDSIYQDTVLLTPAEKNIILSVINNSRSFTIDNRFQNILNSVESDVNFYTGKKIRDIKNDF